MAWIRRVRTASGATAVQIAESVAGRRRIVRHVGSARDEAELGLLIDQARQLLVDDRQGVLDLGISPAARKAVMVPPPAPAALLPGTAAQPVPAPTVSAPRVLKTSCQTLKRNGNGLADYCLISLNTAVDQRVRASTPFATSGRNRPNRDFVRTGSRGRVSSDGRTWSAAAE